MTTISKLAKAETKGETARTNHARQNKTHAKKISAQEIRIAELKKLIVYYKEIIETIREPFIILDKGLTVVTANRAFYRKFKVKKSDTEGKLIYKLGNSQWDSPELREMLEHILPKHRILSNYEVTHNFPTLGRRIMILNARQVDSKQLIMLAMEDVTEQRRLKNDSDEVTSNLITQRDQLQGLNDAKDEFISLASHQLRTPATVVKQYVGMLTNDYAGKITNEQRRMLDVAYQSNEWQLEIIEDLLRVARVDDGKVYLEKSTCDVGKQTKAAIKGQAILFKSRGQKVTLIEPKQPVMAFIDQKLMLMVLENILDNAGKYSKGNSTITVDVSQDNTDAMVSIKDKGVGIHKKDFGKLFKKFSRIDNPLSVSVRGTGLGLYWAKKIVDLHEGSIEVKSQLNKGSAFVVKVPIHPDYLSKLALVPSK